MKDHILHITKPLTIFIVLAQAIGLLGAGFVGYWISISLQPESETIFKDRDVFVLTSTDFAFTNIGDLQPIPNTSLTTKFRWRTNLLVITFSAVVKLVPKPDAHYLVGIGVQCRVDEVPCEPGPDPVGFLGGRESSFQEYGSHTFTWVMRKVSEGTHTVSIYWAVLNPDGISEARVYYRTLTVFVAVSP